MNQHRQLALAWRLYAEDNREVLVYASTGTGGRAGGSVPPTANPSNPDNSAWSGAHMDFDGANRGNWDPSYDMMKRPLWSYVKAAALFKCPSDHSTVLTANNGVKDRILTMSMNLFVGGFAPVPGVDPLPNGTDGHWPQADPFKIYSKLSSIDFPSSIFVFLDMREDVVNWSNFMTDMTGYPNNPGTFKVGGDMPGIYHNRACGFSFSDGHSEIKKWLDGRTTPSLAAPPNLPTLDTTGGNNQDVAWLQDHSTRPK